MNRKVIEEFLVAEKVPRYRMKQISKAIYQDGLSGFNEISVLPERLRNELTGKFKVLSFHVDKLLESSDLKTYKASLKLLGGEHIETVLISSKPGFWTACISCQTGCVLGCAFCATGKISKMRNLNAEEITDQVLFWKQLLRKKDNGHKLTNVVYMGMGEPFLNWKAVSESISELISIDSFNMRSRAISVSTAGIPKGIVSLAEKFPQVNLAVSLHSVDQKVRERLMPIARKYDLNQLAEALKKYNKLCNRQVFLEYMLLSGINDSEKDARMLAKWVISSGKVQLFHVNLISYNPTGNNFNAPTVDRTRKFKNWLLRQGIGVTVRKSLGQDIRGACGQLAAKDKAIKKTDEQK
jgi:23S rRNA (adenine2503-C2)-methyltransferase